jgi:hypothetical protein
MGKPQRFQIGYDKGKWTYSFSGHRFDATDRPGSEFTPYVEALAHLHHEYSVDGIAQHMARLRLNAQLRYLAEYLPLDLYVLEMCDQIEASVASSFLEDNDPTARVFMDFQFGTLRPGRYHIDPFAFKGDEVTLPIEWAEIAPDGKLVAEVIKAAQKGEAFDERRRLTGWLTDALRKTSLQQTEVTLCPWMK